MSYAAHHWHWPLIVIVRLTGDSSSCCPSSSLVLALPACAALELHLELQLLALQHLGVDLLEYLGVDMGVDLERLSWSSNCYGAHLRFI